MELERRGLHTLHLFCWHNCFSNIWAHYTLSPHLRRGSCLIVVCLSNAECWQLHHFKDIHVSLFSMAWFLYPCTYTWSCRLRGNRAELQSLTSCFLSLDNYGFDMAGSFNRFPPPFFMTVCLYCPQVCFSPSHGSSQLYTHWDSLQQTHSRVIRSNDTIRGRDPNRERDGGDERRRRRMKRSVFH